MNVTLKEKSDSCSLTWTLMYPWWPHPHQYESDHIVFPVVCCELHCEFMLRGSVSSPLTETVYLVVHLK